MLCCVIACFLHVLCVVKKWDVFNNACICFDSVVVFRLFLLFLCVLLVLWFWGGRCFLGFVLCLV